MTDSLKECLDLRPMPEEARREVQVYHAQTKDKANRNVGDRYAKAISTNSPLTGTGMQIKTYWDGAEPDQLQSQVVASLNIPNAIYGHNCEHGTSVFAAGVAGLQLLKLWMVRDGVPGKALDLLTTDHISLHGATVTFLLQAKSELDARAAVLKLKDAARILGLNPTGNDSTNESLYVERGGYGLLVYHKTDFSHCVFPDEEAGETAKARARRLVRIEVNLRGQLLRERGWDYLESWRDAYAQGRYEAIFNEMVRGLFKLDLILRHKAPRKEVMHKLTPTESAIVLGYLEGTPVDELPSICDGKTDLARQKLKSKWKKILRKSLRIDITIPWADHQALRHADVDRLLRYPGDYQPGPDTASYSFCAESWPSRLASMKSALKTEMLRQQARRKPV